MKESPSCCKPKFLLLDLDVCLREDRPSNVGTLDY